LASYIAPSARAKRSSALTPGSIIATPTLAVASSPAARACSAIAAVSPGRGRGGAVLVDADQDHGELVAADACGDVGRAAARLQRGRDGGQQPVADRVAVRLVDPLGADRGRAPLQATLALPEGDRSVAG
jgi:hypothetical protein